MADVEYWVLKYGKWTMLPIEWIRYPSGEFQLKRSISELKAEAVPLGATAEVVVLRSPSASALVRMQLLVSSGAPDRIISPYLPAARSDKGSTGNLPYYTGILAGTRKLPIVTLDVHNPKVDLTRPTYVKNVNVTEAVKLSPVMDQKYDCVIVPDAGARTRAAQVAELLDIPYVLTATKEHDPKTGRITNYQIGGKRIPDCRYLVVDDIFDGGVIFHLLTEILRTDATNIDLWVTHGVFSGLASSSITAYNTVFTTNSLINATQFSSIAPNVHVTDITNLMLNTDI